MAEQPAFFFSSVSKREFRLYFVVIAAILAALFFYNVFTLQPALTRAEFGAYTLFTLALILEYGYLFIRPLQAFSTGRAVMVFWGLFAVWIYGIARILGVRTAPYVFLLIFDGYMVATFLKRWVAVSLVVIFVIIIGLAYNTKLGWYEGLLAWRTSLVWVAAAVVSAEVAVRQWRQRDNAERLLIELEEAHALLRERTVQAEELAVGRERARLAQDLHDTVGHTLTALDVQLELLVRLPAGQTEQRRLAARLARTLIKEGLSDVRRAVQALRPLALETFSLPEAIARLAADFERTTQVPVQQEIDDDGSVTLPPAAVLPLYRAAQEALTNIQRHAPSATRVVLRLSHTSDAVTLFVENDGLPASTDPPPEGESPLGFGLIGLRERAAAQAGTFRAGPAGGGLFRLEMALPLKAPS